MFTHRPLVGVTFCFALGIILERSLHCSFTVCVVVAFCILLGTLFLVDHKSLSRLFLYLLFIMLGLVAALNARQTPLNHIEKNIVLVPKAKYWLEGIVVSDIQTRSFIRGSKIVFVLEVKKWQLRPQTGENSSMLFQGPASSGSCCSSGRVLVNIFSNVDLDYGDYVFLEGKLYVPFDFNLNQQFGYRKYLQQKGIQWILSVGRNEEVNIIKDHTGNPLKKAALQTRKKLKGVLTRYLSKNAAGIMNALILGERYDIPQNIKDLFVKTGTTHILAISGFNVGIVAFLVFLFLNVLRLPRRIQYIGTILIIIFYAVLTGSQPSVVRATIMAVIFLFSFLLEKESDSLNSLALAALIILLINPFDLFAVGFQLSFLSVFFIVILCPKLLQWISSFWKEINSADFKWYVFIVQTLIVSIVACLGVSGLIAYYFHIFTPITILANLIIIPLTSLNTALGMGLIFAGLFCPAVADLFSACIHLSLNVMLMIIYFFSQLPGAYIILKNVTIEYVCFYYICLLGIIFGRDLYKIFRKSLQKYFFPAESTDH